MTLSTEMIAPSGFDVVLSSRAAVIVGAVAAYVATCRMLRYARRDREHSRRSYHDVESFQKMSATEAQEIVEYVISCEFPLLSEKALSFALFK